jgi:hypothetical protein
MAKKKDLPASYVKRLPLFVQAVAKQLTFDTVRNILQGKQTSTVRTIRISPTVADSWLDYNTDNRNVRREHKRKLANDSAAGAFIETPNPIAFGKDGTLYDGQHRLLACVESNKPILALVVFNASKESRKHIDGGAPRNTVERGKLGAGLVWLTNVHAAIINGVVNGASPSRTKLSVNEIEKYAREWMDELREVGALFSGYKGTKRGIAIKPVYTVLFRAWLQPKSDRDAITRFAQVLLSGDYEHNYERVANLLRSMLIGMLVSQKKVGDFMKYRLVENALYSFLKKRNVKQLKMAGRELFPLPGDGGRDVVKERCDREKEFKKELDELKARERAILEGMNGKDGER